MLNPITQMKQKGKQTALNRTQTSKTALTHTMTASKANPPQNASKAVLSIVNYPQWNRQFELSLAAIERCYLEFPDFYHFKHQLAKECKDLNSRLHSGKALLQKLAQIRPLTPEEHKDFKAFMRAVGYLSRWLNTTAEHVEQVEAGTNQKHYHDPNFANKQKPKQEADNAM